MKVLIEVLLFSEALVFVAARFKVRAINPWLKNPLIFGVPTEPISEMGVMWIDQTRFLEGFKHVLYFTYLPAARDHFYAALPLCCIEFTQTS
jgi:hypothetical protein